MPRPLRIKFPNACYHVMNRGAGRKNIFKNTYHRLIFLELLEECHKIYNLNIYAYCLMDNHYHLLVSTPDANISRVMRHINGVYTQKFNRSSKTDGSLFRGRYKAQLVDDDCYQLIVSRYIHLNPKEAGLVNNPVDYKWSSYAAYLGRVKMPSWLSADVIIQQLSHTKLLSHIKNYQIYVEEMEVEEINVFTCIKNTMPIVGSQLFKDKMLAKVTASTIQSCSSDINRIKVATKIELIIREVCLFYNINREHLIYCKSGKRNWPKMMCMYICRKKFGHLLRDVAVAFELHRYEAVSTVVLKCQSILLEFPKLNDEIEEVVERIRAVVAKL
jgi:putative transposase